MLRRLALLGLVALSACVRQYPNRPLPDQVSNANRYIYRDRPDRAAGDPFVVRTDLHALAPGESPRVL